MPHQPAVPQPVAAARRQKRSTDSTFTSAKMPMQAEILCRKFAVMFT
jgi:hypothetical protein